MNPAPPPPGAQIAIPTTLNSTRTRANIAPAAQRTEQHDPQTHGGAEPVIRVIVSRTSGPVVPRHS
jgi:hypothetical protein